MDIKKEAYDLHKKGLSFKEIGDKLNISKTTAFEYVKEIKLTRRNFFALTVPNNSEPVLNGRSEQIPTKMVKIPNDRSEQKKEVKNVELSEEIKQIIPPPKIKTFTGDQLLQKQFVLLPFEGKFRELIGQPEKLFSAVIWGLPKGGKSNLAIRFADYLQEYFGKVLYIAAEEGESVSLQQKFRDIGGSKVTVLETRNRDQIREYLKTDDSVFIFIDSINVAGIDNEFLESLKVTNTAKSFIAVVQATKSGNFKGDQALTHNCDFIIKVDNGVASHEGRFGPSSEVKIFEEPLYRKNLIQTVEAPKLTLPAPKAFLRKIDWAAVEAKERKLKEEKEILLQKMTPRKIGIEENKGSGLTGLLLLGTGLVIANFIFRRNGEE